MIFADGSEIMSERFSCGRKRCCRPLCGICHCSPGHAGAGGRGRWCGRSLQGASVSSMRTKAVEGYRSPRRWRVRGVLGVSRVCAVVPLLSGPFVTKVKIKGRAGQEMAVSDFKTAENTMTSSGHAQSGAGNARGQPGFGQVRKRRSAGRRPDVARKTASNAKGQPKEFYQVGRNSVRSRGA